MDITDIKPVTIEFQHKTRAAFRQVEIIDDEYRYKPRAKEFRQLLKKHEMTQREAADLVGVPWSTFQSWLATKRQHDLPAYALKKLKQELER